MIEPNILAFQNADLLAAIEDAPNGQWTVTDLASYLGRDDSNTGKTLRRLTGEGILLDPPLSGLSETGKAQLAAFKRAKHGGERRKAKGRWPLDKFERNPGNRAIDPESVLGLADAIAGVGDILMPLVASMPDANGVRTIWAGERRWIAATRLAQLGQLPPPLLEGLPFVEREADAAEAAVIAVVENSARADLTPWEDAQLLCRAADATGLNATELARRIGRAREGDRGGVRDVQMKLKVAREATADAIALYERNGSWDQLRDSVSRVRPVEQTIPAATANTSPAAPPADSPNPAAATPPTAGEGRNPLMVNGVLFPNATRAAEARRLAGIDPNPSNTGGGGSRTLKTALENLTEDAAAEAAEGPGNAPYPRPEGEPTPETSLVRAALEHLIEQVEEHLRFLRASFTAGVMGDPGDDAGQAPWEHFDSDVSDLVDAVGRAEAALSQAGLVDDGELARTLLADEAGRITPIEWRGQTIKPAVPIRKSITPDYIVCLEDGRRYVGGLKRYLRTRYDLSPDEYREKWGLPADYPMVAPNYARKREMMLREAASRAGHR